MKDIQMLETMSTIDSKRARDLMNKIIKNQELQIELLQIIIKKIYEMQIKKSEEYK